MNHPKREEWIPYLYGEANPEAQRDLKAHLDSCSECRAELAGWQQSLSRLDAWKLPRARRATLCFWPILKWSGAIAGLVLSLGLIVGHAAAPKPDLQTIRAALEPELRQELRAELAKMIQQELNKATVSTLAKAEEQSAKAIAAFATNLEAKQSQDYRDLHSALLVLKGQLDTVAMNTDAGLRQAEQNLVQLADYKEPGKPSTQP